MVTRWLCVLVYAAGCGGEMAKPTVSGGAVRVLVDVSEFKLYAVRDPETGATVYVSVGHRPIAVLPASQTVEPQR